MKLRKLNLKKAALITITSAAIMVSGCNQKTTPAGAETDTKAATETTVESNIEVETNTETFAEIETETNSVVNEPKESAKKEVVTYNEEELYDDLLSTVDGYSEVHDYDNILNDSTTKVEEVKETEVPADTTKAEDNSTNSYQQVDGEGDKFVFVSPDGEFVENAAAPEEYATEDKNNTTQEKAEVTEETNTAVKSFFAKTDETIVNYINAGDVKSATEYLTDTIVSGLDFLFYEGKINEVTKKQVDKDTIAFVVNQLNNNIEIANSLTNVWTSELADKYIEAMNFLNTEDIDKFDAIGKEIKANYPDEEKVNEQKTKSK